MPERSVPWTPEESCVTRVPSTPVLTLWYETVFTVLILVTLVSFQSSTHRL